MQKRIDRLFLRFAANYGPVWRSQLKSDEFLNFAKREWMDGLKRFNDDILDLAIENCQRTLELPPTLPKFIEICRNFYNGQCVSAKPLEYQRDYRSQVGYRALKEIKNMLRS